MSSFSLIVLASPFPELLQLRQAHEEGLAVGPHPARVVVDDVLEARAAGLDAEELVHLLLVLDHGEAHSAWSTMYSVSFSMESW